MPGRFKKSEFGRPPRRVLRKALKGRIVFFLVTVRKVLRISVFAYFTPTLKGPNYYWCFYANKKSSQNIKNHIIYKYTNNLHYSPHV